jgi:hypothetical protein
MGEASVRLEQRRTATAQHRPALRPQASTLPNRLRSLRTTFADQRDAKRLANLGQRPAVLIPHAVERGARSSARAASARAGMEVSYSAPSSQNPFPGVRQISAIDA